MDKIKEEEDDPTTTRGGDPIDESNFEEVKLIDN
jgi:hypothetical protein